MDESINAQLIDDILAPSEISMEKMNGGCVQVCQRCDGTGYIGDEECFSCGGTGWRR